MGEVHVEHHLPPTRATSEPARTRTGCGLQRRLRFGLGPGAGFGLEAEGELAPGQVPGGDRAPHIQRVFGAEGGELGGSGTQGVVEVEGIGEVELGIDPCGAGEGDLVEVDVEVPPVRSGLAAFGGQVGHEPGDRSVDQPLGLGRTSAVGVAGQLGIDVLGGLGGEAQGLLGDPAGPPRRQRPGPDAGPDPGQSAGQLEGFGDQPPPRPRREAQGGGELGDRELRDQRATLPGDRDPGVAAVLDQPRRRILGIGHLMGQRPLHCRGQHPGLRSIGLGPGPTGGRKDPCRVECLGARVHAPESRRGHRHFRPQIALSLGEFSNFLEKLSRPGSTTRQPPDRANSTTRPAPSSPPRNHPGTNQNPTSATQAAASSSSPPKSHPGTDRSRRARPSHPPDPVVAAKEPPRHGPEPGRPTQAAASSSSPPNNDPGTEGSGRARPAPSSPLNNDPGTDRSRPRNPSRAQPRRRCQEHPGAERTRPRHPPSLGRRCRTMPRHRARPRAELAAQEPSRHRPNPLPKSHHLRPLLPPLRASSAAVGTARPRG